MHLILLEVNKNELVFDKEMLNIKVYFDEGFHPPFLSHLQRSVKLLFSMTELIVDLEIFFFIIWIKINLTRTTLILKI